MLCLSGSNGFIFFSSEPFLKLDCNCVSSFISTNNLCYFQEEYIDGENIGVLECGHDFHTHCIKQWLMQKNLCPICKTTGLGSRE